MIFKIFEDNFYVTTKIALVDEFQWDRCQNGAQRWYFFSEKIWNLNFLILTYRISGFSKQVKNIGFGQFFLLSTGRKINFWVEIFCGSLSWMGSFLGLCQMWRIFVLVDDPPERFFVLKFFVQSKKTNSWKTWDCDKCEIEYWSEYNCLHLSNCWRICRIFEKWNQIHGKPHNSS